MSMFDKLKDFMIDKSDEYDTYDDFDEYDEDPVNTASPSSVEEDTPKIRSISSRNNYVKPKKMNGSENEVCVFKPVEYEESNEIMDALKSNKTIVLNLEFTDPALGQRILDCIIGCCYALGGTLQRISNSTFIATPPTVNISGDIQDTLSASLL